MTDPTERWRLAGVGAQLIGLSAMSVIYALQALLPAIAAEYGRTAFEANLVVSMTTLGIAAGVFPMAWIADRIGRGTTISIALAAGGVFTALTATATDWTMLVVVRMLTGVAISAVLVSALVWASEAVPRRYARRVAGGYIAGTTAGGMAGRIVAGGAAQLWDWRIGVAVVDAIVILTAAGGIGCVFVYERVSRRRDAPARRAETRRTDVPHWSMRVRLFAIGFLAMAPFVGLLNALVFRMVDPPFSFGLGIASLMYLTYIAGTVSSLRAGIALDRIGVRATILVGTLICAAGVAATLVEGVVVIVVGLLALSAGFFVVHTAASATVPTVSPRPTAGSAWYTLSYYAGSSAGALLLGFAWDVGRWPAVVATCLALFAAAAAVAATLPRHRPQLVERPGE